MSYKHNLITPRSNYVDCFTDKETRNECDTNTRNVR